MNSKMKDIKEVSVISNNSTRGYSVLNSEKSDKKLSKQLVELIKSELKLSRFRNRKIIRNVLVVAGNFQTRHLCELVLRKYSFSITTISNIDEILDIINGNYEAILFDETECNKGNLDIIDVIKMTSPEVKLLTFSRNLNSNQREDASTSHKIASNNIVREESELASEASTIVSAEGITINESV